MNIQRGDVVLVDYPFSDRSGSKVRPALVVLANRYNAKLDHTILALISSSRARFVGDPCQLPIDLSTPEGQQSGLRTDSVVQFEILTTVKRSLVLRILGRLPAPMMRKADLCLRDALGIR